MRVELRNQRFPAKAQGFDACEGPGKRIVILQIVKVDARSSRDVRHDHAPFYAKLFRDVQGARSCMRRSLFYGQCGVCQRPSMNAVGHGIDLRSGRLALKRTVASVRSLSNSVALSATVRSEPCPAGSAVARGRGSLRGVESSVGLCHQGLGRVGGR
jgi:hypothetical protein